MLKEIRPSEAVESHCQDLYRRTRELWLSLKGQYPTWCCRFSILYGPPISKPDLFIVGQNPGFDQSDLYDEEIQTWPAKNEYANANWRLATKLRFIFTSAGLERLLERSLGTNLWFFKSKGVGKHPTGLGWKDNSAVVRKQLEEYCTEELAKLMGVIKPKAILALGLAVFDQLADHRTRDVIGAKGRRVASIGQSNGILSIGIIHPTGAQVSREDWKVVAAELSELLGGDDLPRTGSPTTSSQQAIPPASAARNTPIRTATSIQESTKARTRQQPFRENTVVKAGKKPTSAFRYEPVHDFWRELSKLGEISVEDFHRHMVATGWRRPQGGALTYAVTCTDIAYMCKNGLAVRLRG